jgi:NAD(P)-dependent dehydrogenase (short-subunit alcohol dehydrogenase family)
MEPKANPWYSLEGKTVWVIGAAGYLGSPITEALDGLCKKVICSELEGRAAALIADKKLTRTVAHNLNATDLGPLPGEVEKIMAEHGVPDGLVYMVAAGSAGKRLEDLPIETFQKTLDAALTPAFLVCRAVAEKMKTRGSGSIVIFSSMYGVVSPDPRIYRWAMTPNPIDYGTTKAAILQMSRYFAVHYGPSGVRFNCITPGPFPNPTIKKTQPEFIQELNHKTPLNRVGINHEIVGPTLFLLTDGASFVTGHNLVVDGGWTAW